MYFFGSGATVPAMSRKILESDLIEKHHWLPQDIAKIPYKKLQEHLLIQKQKMINLDVKTKTSKANFQPAKGQRKFIREI